MKTLKLLSALLVIAILALTLVAVVAAAKVTGHLLAPISQDAAYYKFCLDVFKVVSVSVMIGVLGIVIPAFLTYSKDKFDRLKDSRAAYSGAKTGVDYLSLRLSAANFSKASRLIQQVHFQKHQAQLYAEELKQHLKLRYEHPVSLDDWDEGMYRKLRNVRILLRNHAAKWDTLSPSQRLEILKPVLPDLDETDSSYKAFRVPEQSLNEDGSNPVRSDVALVRQPARTR